MSIKKQIEIPSCSECESHCDNTLFCDLTKGELDILSDSRADNFYKKGQVIFYEGNRGHGLFCIHSGKVKIHKLGDDGKDQIMRFGKKSDVLGYRSFLGDEPYNATATALEDSVICYVPKSKFSEVLENNGKLAHKAIQMLTKDLKIAEKKIISISQKPVVERVSEALLIMKETFGFKADGKSIDVILTRRDIADLAGVTTETTIRTLSDLNKEEVIKLNGKQILIENLPQLIRLANLND